MRHYGDECVLNPFDLSSQKTNFIPIQVITFGVFFLFFSMAKNEIPAIIICVVMEVKNIGFGNPIEFFKRVCVIKIYKKALWIKPELR
jgi:hypothetical protein